MFFIRSYPSDVFNCIHLLVVRSKYFIPGSESTPNFVFNNLDNSTASSWLLFSNSSLIISTNVLFELFLISLKKLLKVVLSVILFKVAFIPLILVPTIP